MNKAVVLQSHRQPLPHEWLRPCLQSVRDWADLNHFDYMFLGDELFGAVADELLDKTRNQKVIASDLARLFKLQSLIRQGYDCVIWCDADFMIFDAPNFSLPESSYTLGREVWVQLDRHNKLRAYRKVHNAFMMFRPGNSFLDFYTDTAEKLLINNNGQMPPQFIGPKLLTALHNIALCPVQENAGMLSPMVIHDLLKGGGEALTLFKLKSHEPIRAANLCGSSVERGNLSDQDMNRVIQVLLNSGPELFT